MSDDTEYKRLIFYVPVTDLEIGTQGWELERALLTEHIHELMLNYGTDMVMDSAKLCEERINNA